ncbi:MAG: hypothetical protein VXA34_00285 [Gammaproteobacteria bacterium]|jgi:hypothetical protein
MMKADGFDDAILGVTVAQWSDNQNVLVYSVDRCLQLLIDQGMDPDEAWEYFDYNVLGAYVGKFTPLFVYEEWEQFLDE